MNMTRPTHQTYAPFNPWSSFLIEASAGSGKTWQLSRRFLALVVAGADPSSILTVTFTKKAAAEMRERIIRDAVKLGSNSKEFASFVDDINSWLPTELRASKKIRSAEDASRLILSKTQTLKITTIDALFMQWSQQFPIETAVTIETADGLESLQSPWDLLSNLGLDRLNNAAWNDVLAMAADHTENRELMLSISENAPNGSIKSLANAIDPLTNSGTFLWYVQMITAREPIRFFEVPESLETSQDLLIRHKELFQSALALISNKDKRALALACLDAYDFDGLISNKIIKSDRDGLNGNTFRSASKNGDPAFVELEQILSHWRANQKLTDLNRTARLIWSLFKAREQAAHHRKVMEAKGTFTDAAKGVSVMACAEHTAGGRAMAWSNIRHLMLDEFQDTSLLQWMIFEKLAIDLLAGQTFDAEQGPRPSVFIVGDKKQSIYRFREAAPEVMDIARTELSKHGLLPLTMSESFRSSSLVLDLVNQVFAGGPSGGNSSAGLIEDYPLHHPAKLAAAGNPIKATYGSVTVYPAADSQETPEGEKISEAVIEARQVAQHIRGCVDGTITMRVYDEHTKAWRSPRFSDFVVLYPKSTHSQLFEDEMRALGIPSRREERKGFFGRPEILDLQALITWLSWPADTVALCTILRSPICGLSDADLQSMLMPANEGAIFQRLRETHPRIHQMLIDIRHSHDKEDISFIVGELLTKQGLTERYRHAFGPLEGPLAQANILKWFDLVRRGSADDALAAETLALALDEAAEEDALGNAALASNAVTMMTIHKSKGLEFPCVILTGTAADWHKGDSGWVKDSRPGREGICYIGTKDVRPKQSPEVDELLRISEEESRREKARLLYVALTRASSHVVITGAQSKNSDSSFFQLIVSAANDLTETQKVELPTLGTMFTRGHIPQSNESQQQTSDKLRMHSCNIPNPRSIGRQSLKILNPSRQAKHNTEATWGEISPLLGDQKYSLAIGKAYGTVVHKLIENHLNAVSYSHQRLVRLALTNCEEALDEPQVESLINDAILEAQTLFASNAWGQILSDARRIHTEVPMASVEGQDLVNAKADLIVEHSDGSLSVVDFKTIKLEITSVQSIEATHALTAACEKLGYSQQVMDYCRIAARAFNAKTVRGLVLFTSPPQVVKVV